MNPATRRRHPLPARQPARRSGLGSHADRPAVRCRPGGRDIRQHRWCDRGPNHLGADILQAEPFFQPQAHGFEPGLRRIPAGRSCRAATPLGGVGCSFFLRFLTTLDSFILTLPPTSECQPFSLRSRSHDLVASTLFDNALNDSSCASRRARLPWEVFAELMQRTRRPRARRRLPRSCWRRRFGHRSGCGRPVERCRYCG